MTNNLPNCPEGMYPPDLDYDEEYDAFADLRAAAEGLSNCLNLPIAWHFDGPDVEYAEPDDEPEFALVFLMPRKGKTLAMWTGDFDRAEVQAWLDTWLRGEINKWFGWTEPTETKED